MVLVMNLKRTLNIKNLEVAKPLFLKPEILEFKFAFSEIEQIESQHELSIAEKDAKLKELSEKLNGINRDLYKKVTDYFFDTLKSKATHKSVKIPSGIHGQFQAIYTNQKSDDSKLTFQDFMAKTLENLVNIAAQHTDNSGHTPSMVADTELPKLDVQPMAISRKKVTCCTKNSKPAQETTPAKGTVPDIEITLPTRLLAKPIALKKLKQQAQHERSAAALQKRNAVLLRILQKSQLLIPSEHKSSAQMELYVTEKGEHFKVTDRLMHFVHALLDGSLTSKQKSKLQSGEFKLTRSMRDLLVKEAHEMVLEFH